MVKDQISAAFQPDLPFERFVKFILDTVLVEDGRWSRIIGHPVDEVRSDALDQFADVLILHLAVNHQLVNLFREQIADNSLQKF